MADQKISELPDAGTPTDTDGYVIERSATSNFRSTWLAIRTALAALFEPAGAIVAHDDSNAAHGGVESNFDSHVAGQSNTHPQLDAHVASTANPHGVTAAQAGAAPSSHVGTGGAEHAAATGAVAGFMAAADKTKLDGVAPGANAYTHPDHTGDVTSSGDGAQTIAADVVTNSKLANMPANTLKLRASTAGDPTDTSIQSLADVPSPTGTDALLAQRQGGDLVRIQVGNLPTGGGGEANLGANVGAGPGQSFRDKTGVTLNFKTLRSSDASVTITDEADTINLQSAGGGGGGDVTSAVDTVDGEVQLGDSPAKGIKGSSARIAAGTLYLEPTSGEAGLRLESADNESEAYYLPGTGPTATRNFSVAAAGGNFQVRARDAGLAIVRNVLTASHAAGATLGSPLGGLPAEAGVLNAQGLEVDGQPVYHPGNLPPSGSGDVTGPAGGTVANELALYDDTTGKVLRGAAGVVVDSLPQLDQANTFTASPQTIASPTSGGGLDITATATPRVRFKSLTGIADRNDQRITQTDTGYLRFAAHDDGGSNVAEMLRVYNQGGVVVGDPVGGDVGVGILNAEAVLEDGNPLLSGFRSGLINQVGYPNIVTVLAGASISPTYAGNRNYYASQTGALTINLDVVDEGYTNILLPASVGAVSFNPAPDLISGADAAGAVRRVHIERTQGVNTVAFETA